MTIETYIVTLKHDRGTTKIKVVSLCGKHGAIQQITAVELCPENAIIKLRLIDSKKV